MLIEFISSDISLFTLYSIQNEIEDKLQKNIDLVHGPINESSFLIANKVVDIYEQ